MDLSGQRFLAYLQEDNTQRVLFRVRPLLSPEGLLAAEDIAGYRDQGFLRIAPDRQEQHTFKERMRELGGLCVLDLREAAQGKVRPNRNYAPGRGESNRYIVYSDAIKALPEDLVYEVVSKEDSRTAPLTPRYYVRSGGFINGPFPMDGETEGGDGASQALPPDCDRLFLVTMPDKQHRLFYWPEEVKEEGRRPAAPRATPRRMTRRCFGRVRICPAPCAPWRTCFSAAGSPRPCPWHRMSSTPRFPPPITPCARRVLTAGRARPRICFFCPRCSAASSLPHPPSRTPSPPAKPWRPFWASARF